MQTSTSNHVELPAPIAGYFAADTTDGNAVARCFSEGAVVVDERREYRGRAAIARWKAEATTKYRYTSEPISAEVSGKHVTVTARLTGEFPGSPIELRYRFVLEGNEIARLEIAS